MSLVSNFIGGISSSQYSGANVSAIQDFDMNDKTFSDLLDKELNKVTPEMDSQEEMLKRLGMPAGFRMENLDGTEFTETAFDQMEAIGEKTDYEKNMTNPFDINNDGDVTTSEAVTFFTSLLDNSTNGENARSELFDFAKKQATNYYNKYSRSVVTDLKEFVSDIHGLM